MSCCYKAAHSLEYNYVTINVGFLPSVNSSSSNLLITIFLSNRNNTYKCKQQLLQYSYGRTDCGHWPDTTMLGKAIMPYQAPSTVLGVTIEHFKGGTPARFANKLFIHTGIILKGGGSLWGRKRAGSYDWLFLNLFVPRAKLREGSARLAYSKWNPILVGRDCLFLRSWVRLLANLLRKELAIAAEITVAPRPGSVK